MLPAGGRPDPRLEREQVELALKDVKHLLGVVMQVRPHVETGPDVDHFEYGEAPGLPVAHFELHGRGDPLALLRH